MATFEQNEEQRRRAFKDAGLTPEQQAGVLSGAGYVPITSADIAPISSPQFPNPAETTVTIANADDFTPAAPTAQESDISKRMKEIVGEQTALAGETATFRAEEEKRLRLEGLKLEESDYFSKLKTQQAEFENLTAEDTRIQERLQQESAGRGITAGGLAPIEAGELRKNFLRKSEKAAEVNITAALLAATQNKFMTAQSLVESAVKNKYGARQATLDANINNLNLLLKDPTLTLEQTNRANAQLAKKEKEKEAEKKKEEDAKKILEWAVKAREGGATALEAQQIANIGLSDKPDIASAFEIYSKYAKKEEKLPSDIESFKLFFPNADITTPAGQQQYLNWKAQEAEAGRKGEEAIPTIKLTPEDNRTLTGSGFSPADISNIQSDINQFGIDKVLEGVTDSTQKTALQKVYGVQQKVSKSDIETRVTQKVAIDGLKGTYTEDELRKLAKEHGFAGFFIGKKKEVENFLNSSKAKELYIDLLYKQYQEAGLAK